MFRNVWTSSRLNITWAWNTLFCLSIPSYWREIVCDPVCWVILLVVHVFNWTFCAASISGQLSGPVMAAFLKNITCKWWKFSSRAKQAELCVRTSTTFQLGKDEPYLLLACLQTFRNFIWHFYHYVSCIIMSCLFYYWAILFNIIVDSVLTAFQTLQNNSQQLQWYCMFGVWVA